MIVQSFVIRIYRRQTRKDRVRLDGVVEEPVSGKQYAFHGRDKLWRILAGGEVNELDAPAGAGKRRKRRPQP